MAKRMIHKEVTYTAPTATLTAYMHTGEVFTRTADAATKAEAIAKVMREHVTAYPGEGYLKGTGV